MRAFEIPIPILDGLDDGMFPQRPPQQLVDRRVVQGFAPGDFAELPTGPSSMVIDRHIEATS